MLKFIGLINYDSVPIGFIIPTTTLIPKVDENNLTRFTKVSYNEISIYQVLFIRCVMAGAQMILHQPYMCDRVE